MTTKIDTIEETVKRAGLGKRKFAKMEIERFRNELPKEEELLGVAFDQKSRKQIYVTDKRVTFIRREGLLGFDKSSILIKDITAIDLKITFLNTKLTVKAGSISEEVDHLYGHVADELRSLLERLKDGYKLD